MAKQTTVTVTEIDCFLAKEFCEDFFMKYLPSSLTTVYIEVLLTAKLENLGIVNLNTSENNEHCTPSTKFCTHRSIMMHKAYLFRDLHTWFI